MNGSSPESSVEPSNNVEQARTRRAYKACLHCRSRKAKCDLGDIDAPSKPPCARCRRERRECVFAPSFRGGKIVMKKPSTGMGEGTLTTEMRERGFDGLDKSTKTPNVATALSVASFSTSDLDLDAEVDRDGPSSSDERPRKTMRLDSPEPDRSSGESSRIDRLDPQSLAAASLRNPTDALNLLALAADVDRAAKSKNKGKGKRRDSRTSRNDGETADNEDQPENGSDVVGLGLDVNGSSSNGANGHSSSHGHHHRSYHARGHAPPPSLSTYRLIREQVLTPAELTRLTGLFFSLTHFIFPMMPHHRIPRTEIEIARFAKEETYLMTAIIVITSRQEKMFDVHEKSWEYMQSLINELILGKVASVGAVEALLLISENLPRRPDPATEDEEHRMSWMLVGMAVRLGYMLGLDQKTLRPLTPSSDDSSRGMESTLGENEKLDRETLAWTYCYIFDRSISIRSGKAFWSRGPGLCFQRTYSGAMASPSETFPSMRPIPGVQDDFASMLQAYTELTQCMASAHDVLYPSKDRTIALVRVGDYHKYLDEFTRSINGFRVNWEEKTWETSVVTECVWLSFHYLRLYIYAFAFQAHVQRSTSTSQDGKKVAETVIFPRGPMGSPDARFILEAIDAATELLKICVDRLHPSGALSYLPWRFFLYFSYAGVFLLKAVFVGAVVPQDQRAIVGLIKKVILCLACASSDDQHYGIRYARLLNGLLRVFSRGVDGITSQVSTPKRKMLTELPPVQTNGISTSVPPPPPPISTPSTLQSTSSALPASGVVAPAPAAVATRMEVDTQSQARTGNQQPRSAIDGTVRQPLSPAESTFYAQAASHASQSMPPANHAQSRPFTNNGNPSAYRHGPGPQQQQQQQQLYAQHAPPPGTNGYNVNPGYDMFQQSNFTFQFDLNWPPMEADGLAQMLSDDHSLDGDFWMSLPNHAQWQQWPVGSTPTTSLN